MAEYIKIHGSLLPPSLQLNKMLVIVIVMPSVELWISDAICVALASTETVHYSWCQTFINQQISIEYRVSTYRLHGWQPRKIMVRPVRAQDNQYEV